MNHIIDGLLAILVERGLLRPDDLNVLREAYAKSEAVRFEEFLLDEAVISKQELLQALQDYYQLPAMDVVGVLFDHATIIKFPKDVMLRNGFIPYERDGDVLQVIAARPQDPELLPAIGDCVSYDIVFMVGIYRDICDAAKEFYDEAVTVVHEEEVSEDEEDLVEQ